MVRRLTLLVVVILVSTWRLDVPSAQALAPTGFGLLVDAQSWWTPEGGKTMHVHVGGVLPLYQPLSGKVPFTLSLKLHQASGFIDKLETSYGNQLNGSLLVGVPTSVQEESIRPLVLDTTMQDQDGWHPFKAETKFRDSDGTQRSARITAGVYLVNGKPLQPTTKDAPALEAHSWFVPSGTDGRGYSNAALLADSIPVQPVSGIWRPKVMVGGSKPGQTRHLIVALDPNVHAGHFGTVIVDSPNVERRAVIVPIDTTTLANGPHKLMIRASDEGMFPRGTLEGVLVVGFEVKN